MYVAVKGGEAAIANAHSLLADRRRGDRSVPALGLDQIVEQLALGVDRVMSEGSLYDRELAALAIVQARGDMIEAIFILRAYRTTLPRFGMSEPVDTATMKIERRVSATYMTSIPSRPSAWCARSQQLHRRGPARHRCRAERLPGWRPRGRGTRRAGSLVR